MRGTGSCRGSVISLIMSGSIEEEKRRVLLDSRSLAVINDGLL